MKRSNANLITLNVVFVVCLIVANVVTSKVLDTGIHIGGVPILIPGAALTYAILSYVRMSSARYGARKRQTRPSSGVLPPNLSPSS